MPQALIDVECPCCKGLLKVNAKSGVVISHKEPPRPAPIEDLASAVADLKNQAARREEVFQKSFADQKTRRSVLDQKFDELLKQAKADPDKGPVKRDIDL